MKKQILPSPSIHEGKYLRKRGLASSMIDLSDGLSSDLRHICEASQVGAEIEAGLLPIEPALRSFFSPEKCLDMALNGGEDFQLLFTGREKKIRATKVPGVTRIGTITASTAAMELISGENRTILEPRGYRHF